MYIHFLSKLILLYFYLFIEHGTCMKTSKFNFYKYVLLVRHSLKDLLTNES